jgi:glutamate formiminotransferase
MQRARLLCIPNFSEGRDETTIHAIADAAVSAGVQIHHLSWDYDHHRMVLAFSGTPSQVRRAVLRAGAVAVERIDLTRHQGAHPRIGAVDVVPFVPLEGLTRAEAIAWSHAVARSFARRLRVPVYLYEHSAREGRASATCPPCAKAGSKAGSAGGLQASAFPTSDRSGSIRRQARRLWACATR